MHTQEITTDIRLCIQLKSLRRAKKLTLEAMHAHTGIALHHLHALEECNYALLPVGTVRRTIVKKYLEMLHTDTEIAADFHEEIAGDSAKKNESTSRARFFSFALTRNMVISICGALILLYLGFEVQAMVAAPPLVVTAPIDATVTSSATTLVHGTTAPETYVTINGAKVLVAKDGSFSETVHLKEGINDMVIVASTRRGTSTKLSRRIFFQKEATL